MSEDFQKRIFSKNLNFYISKCGRTQKEIADSIHVSPQTFNTWCQGIAIPRMSKIQMLADYFRISKSDLLDFQSPIRDTSETEMILRQSGYPVCRDEVDGVYYTYIRFQDGTLEVSEDELNELGDVLFECIDHEINVFKRSHFKSWRD